MSISAERLVKAYGEHVVVNRVSFEVAEGECFVLLGPSGSGKTTVLRMLAGLVEADSGRVLLRGNDVTRMSPQRRGLGMVFQQYALFGHMTVAANIEFPLGIRRVPARDRTRRRDELLELVGLVGLESRYPHQLSGGQQQRVALARALAHRPEVLLLDEPFGALDARIRVELRRTLRRIQQDLAVTTLFVTHDQEEAFELADHVGVMNFGRLLETGPPEELYLRPQTEFVAGFLGKANLLATECTDEGVRLGDLRVPLGTDAAGEGQSRRVQVLSRPEDLSVKLTREALSCPALGRGVVEETAFSGSYQRLRLRLPRLDGVRPLSPAVPFGSDHMLVEATRSQHLAHRFPLAPGDVAWVGVRRLHALTHPGLSFLVRDDGSPRADAALRAAGDLARVCHARVTVLLAGDGDGGRVQAVREMLGSGLAGLDLRPIADASLEELARQAELHPSDLLIVDAPRRDRAGAVLALLSSGEHHLLLVPETPRPMRDALVCVAAGEPGKADVFFAGRLLRHLGASVTLLTAVPEGAPRVAEQVERFHAAALRTLALFGIAATSTTPHGTARDAILAQLRSGGHDLLVIGTPFIRAGRHAAPSRIVRALLAGAEDVPVLVVGSDRRES